MLIFNVGEAFLATSVPYHAAKGAEGVSSGEQAKQ